MNKTSVKIAIFIIFAFVSSNADAARPDNSELLKGAKKCTQYFNKYEKKYGIPKHLLAAIANTESGRYHNDLEIRVPWPWTINAQGRGYYYKTRNEAIAAVYNLQAKGIKSIDIGCMQVNIMHHGQNFASIRQAFEPENNVAYAAKYLHTNYKRTGSWKEAAGDYHSKTPSRGTKYVNRVKHAWNEINSRVTHVNRSRVLKSHHASGFETPKMIAYKKHMKVIDVEKTDHQTDKGVIITAKQQQALANQNNKVQVINLKSQKAQAEKTGDDNLFDKMMTDAGNFFTRHGKTTQRQKKIADVVETGKRQQMKVVKIASKEEKINSQMIIKPQNPEKTGIKATAKQKKSASFESEIKLVKKEDIKAKIDNLESISKEKGVLITPKKERELAKTQVKKIDKEKEYTVDSDINSDKKFEVVDNFINTQIPKIEKPVSRADYIAENNVSVSNDKDIIESFFNLGEKSNKNRSNTLPNFINSKNMLDVNTELVEYKADENVFVFE